jgi:hypothetical protein
MEPDFRWYTPADFAARIRIFTPEEGGRKTWAYNGIRWDFAYLEPNGKPGRTFMIWPLFCDARGQPLPSDQPLPAGEWLHARLFILLPEPRVKVHQPRIRPGVSFFCMEGRPAAEGTMTEIPALFAPRRPDWPGNPPAAANGIY